MRYASVCSGVEAASLAWGKLGWTPVFFAEVEPFPCAVLQQRFNATKPLHPLDPAEAVDEKDRKMRESWLKQINKLPDTGTIPNLGDFTKIKGEDYVGAVDLLVGGTPCQDLSVAGKRAGFEGARSSLALDFVRLAYEARCKYFVWENVPGVFSSNRGRDFATLLSMFCGYEIDVPEDGWKSSGIVQNRRHDRYGIAWRVLDAQYTRTPGFPFAVPQRRRRVFLVGCLGDWERAASILLEPDRLSWNTPSRIKKREALAGNAGAGTAKTNVFWNGDDVANCITRRVDQNRMPDKDNFHAIIENDVCGTLKARPAASPFPERGQTVVCETGKGFYRENESAGTLEQHEDQHRRNIVCFHGSQDPISNNTNAIGRNGGLENCICQYGSVAGTLKAKHDGSPCADNGMNVVCYDAQGVNNGQISGTITGDHNNRVTDYTQLVQNVSPALDSSMYVKNQTQDAAKYAAVAIAENIIGRQDHTGGNGVGAQDELAYTQNATGVMGVSYRKTVRRLLPVEAERLMGFPDNHTRIAWNGKPEEECPDAPRYKACGNSMCVNVMEWIGRRIEEYAK